MVQQSFHNTVDAKVRAYQTYIPGKGWQGGGTHHITTWQRSLTYQFFPHFHPYVTSLIQRLNDGGVAELLGSDTLYLPQPNPANGQALQPLTVLKDSTRATLVALPANTNVTRVSDNSVVTITAGTPLTLPDNTWVTVKAGTLVGHPDGSTSALANDTRFQVPGGIPVASASGIEFPAAPSDIIVPDYSNVTVGDTTHGAQQATLTYDGSTVVLPVDTKVAIRSGLPVPVFYQAIFDPTHYAPEATSLQGPWPLKDIDFSYDGAYSIYNWELFFHAPLLMAIHLSQNQQFQEAQKWFHYIFNPADNSPGPTPERFWKVEPFQYTDVAMIQDILLNLAAGQDKELQDKTVDSIKDWKQNPFQPWAVAKCRPTAYMLKTVMAYLDNLIAWGDSLFRQYTIETVNEATQLYIMAANILGPRPQEVPKKGSVKSLTYNDLRGKLDAFGNALVEMEVDIPFDIVSPVINSNDATGSQILTSLGQTLYFSIPRNDRLLAYWDTVADRLFKIHNSLNLQGVFQRLPLYEPPIDPALLVRAAAAGLDVSAIVSGLNQPLPLVRFQFLLPKAAEICQEVKALGANILAAIEKQDNESLSLMRAQHESTILTLVETVKYSQWQETIKSRQGLEQSLTNAIQRYSYYQKLLGRSDTDISSSLPSGITVGSNGAQLNDVDDTGLENLSFTQGDVSAEPQMGFDAISPDIATDATAVSEGETKSLTAHETEDIKLLGDAQTLHDIASVLSVLSAILSPIPTVDAAATPLGVGGKVGIGGLHLRNVADGFAAALRGRADHQSYRAGKTSKLGSYSRRELDWTFQSNSAKGEINQILKQIRAAQIREAIAQQEYKNHQTQMKNAQQIIDFLKGNDVGPDFMVKESTIDFYAWMKREVRALYAKAFQLAFEAAKKAERALQNELGDPTLTYIQYNYLDGNEGLLAGEKLLFDIKAMEIAYHDLNHREYEMTKHVSLLQVDPLALMQLRATGTCSFTLPEELFDMDGPGHYFRRTDGLAVTIPCVAGAHTSVNCTLTLQKSSIRISADPGKDYARQGSDDPRFNDYYGTIQSIVTSSAQSDSGLFESSLRDERYRPLEKTGIAGSQWQLTLPSDVRQFDFDTITDVILHVRYTAREGGETLKQAAIKNLKNRINNAQTVGSICLFSVRHDFPSQWAKFQNVDLTTSPTAELALTLVPELYPFWAQGIVGSAPVKAVEFFAEMAPGDTTSTINVYAKANKSVPASPDTLNHNPALGGLLTGSLANIKPLPTAVSDGSPFTVYFDKNSMQDLWLAITWGK